jgi:hypothetical protein
MPHHISPLKNNSENSRACHVTSHHVTFVIWKLILKIQENQLILCHISPLKNNSKNSRKIYYKSLRVINGESPQHASMSCHPMSPHISPLKNNSENSKKYIFQVSPSIVEK